MRRFTDTNPDELAIEHCLWAASEGLQPREVIASVGADASAMPAATWHDAQFVLAGAWNTFLHGNAAIRKALNTHERDG